MGCSGSRHSQPVAPQDGVWSLYDELVNEILANPLKGPTEHRINDIRSRPQGALEPTNKTDPPLLVVAKDHDEWFRWVNPLIEACTACLTISRRSRSFRSELYGKYCSTHVLYAALSYAHRDIDGSRSRHAHIWAIATGPSTTY